MCRPSSSTPSGWRRFVLAAALPEVDAVVVLTPHPSFDLELVRREAPLVLDTRAAVEPGERVFRL